MKIATKLMAEFEITKIHAIDMIETFLVEIAYALKQEESVKIVGLGTFSVRNKKERKGFNPRTGEPVLISSRKSISFHPSGVLKEKINSKQ
jgi:integration host factor subunit alpha